MQCMTCYPEGSNTQAPPRSRHVGGLFAAFCDGSVHFIADTIDNGGPGAGANYEAFDPPPYGHAFNPTVWDHLITCCDGGQTSSTDFE